MLQNPAYRPTVYFNRTIMIEKIKRLWAFISDDIWRITEHEVSKKRSSLYTIIKTITLSLRRFTKDNVSDQASALTYNTLLSIVPLLAILFAIARGFGFANLVENLLHTGMGGQPAAISAVLEFTNSYLEHTKSGVFIGFGLALLLWTVINLIANIEKTFNQIWEVKKQRSIFRKVTDYFSMFLLIPLLVVLSSGISIFMTTLIDDMTNFVLLAPIGKFLVQLIPFVLTWFMFAGLYVFMPNTNVKFKYALISGIVVGTVYQLFQYVYISGQIWVSKYNAIYGSFAAIPLLLLWLQTSWTIILFGVELTYSAQNINDFNFEKDTENISRRYRDFLCLIILSLICKQFEKGAPPYTAHDISREHKIPIRLTNQILYQLQDLKFINEISGDEQNVSISYQPAMDINQINVAMLLDKIDSFGSEDFKIDKEDEFHEEWETVLKAREDYYRSSSKVLVKDL